jgi:hypothetical protein
VIICTHVCYVHVHYIANVRFGTHVTCQVATRLKDKFKVSISTNNTLLFLFQFYISLLQFVKNWKIKVLKCQSTPHVTRTITGNNLIRERDGKGLTFIYTRNEQPYQRMTYIVYDILQ